jgi:hypothetical protein
MIGRRTTAHASRRAAADWRRQLRREIVWLLLAKVAALTLLWAAFFSPSHRFEVTREQAAAQLAVGDTPATAPAHRSHSEDGGGTP